MGKKLIHLGEILVISRRNRSVRQSLILLFTNIILMAGFVFTLEIILIFLGVGNIFIPYTAKTVSFLQNFL